MYNSVRQQYIEDYLAQTQQTTATVVTYSTEASWDISFGSPPMIIGNSNNPDIPERIKCEYCDMVNDMPKINKKILALQCGACGAPLPE